MQHSTRDEKRKEIGLKLEKLERDKEVLVTKRKQLALDVAKDEKTNRQMQQRQFGKPVEHGQTVQLQHVYTNKCLSVSDTDTAELAVQLVVNLQEHSNRSTEFQIHVFGIQKRELISKFSQFFT